MSRLSALERRFDIVSAYRRLFLDDEGRLRPDARIVFADVRDHASLAEYGAARDSDGRIDPIEHVYRDGKRSLFEHMNRRVSEDPAIILNQMKAEQE